MIMGKLINLIKFSYLTSNKYNKEYRLKTIHASFILLQLQKSLLKSVTDYKIKDVSLTFPQVCVQREEHPRLVDLCYLPQKK